MGNENVKQNRSKKILMILLSILISVGIWVYVDQNTTVSTTISDIPIEFRGADTTLADRGLMVLENNSDTVISIMLTGSRQWIARLDPAKVRVQVDLSKITQTGTNDVTYRVIYPSPSFTGHLTLQSVTPSQLTVDIGELYSKTVDIHYDIEGNVADGYIAGTVALQPEKLEIRGQQEDIDKVSYAKVTLPVGEAKETVSKKLDYTFYDKNDHKLEKSGIHATADQIQATLPVSVIKDLKLTMNFIESPGYSLSNVEYTIQPSTITVSGDAALLSDVDTITLDDFNLTKLGEANNYNYAITVPEGCKNLSGVTRATLKITFKDMTTSTLTAVKFESENKPEGKEVSILTSELDVTLCGTAADVASVKAEDLTVVANLGEVSSASGSYTVPATVKIDTSKDVGTVGSYQVNVTIADPAQNNGEPAAQEEPQEETTTAPDQPEQ